MALGILALLACNANPPPSPPPPPPPVALPAPQEDAAAVHNKALNWRAKHLFIDLHEHVDATREHLARAVLIQDAVGIGLAVNLSGGYVTRQGRAQSDFQAGKALTDRLYPGRFVEYMNLDYTDWDRPDFADRAVAQVEEGVRLGASGFKEFKRLGLGLRDRKGQLIKIDDPKLDPMWKRLGELGMPVSIHVADPRAFWLPFDATNERWEELKDHKNWWFGDPATYPAREQLLAALERVIARHPETTFVSVHFANNAEDLDWVDKQLDAHPNMMADLAARIPEIGRHDPEAVRRVFIKQQDRILFATDFQVYDHLTLGSGGSGPPPTDENAVTFFDKHWEWLETRDKIFPTMTPIQGNWAIQGIGLSSDVLEKIYFGNARRLLARTLPPSATVAPAGT